MQKSARHYWLGIIGALAITEFLWANPLHADEVTTSDEIGMEILTNGQAALRAMTLELTRPCQWHVEGSRALAAHLDEHNAARTRLAGGDCSCNLN